MPRKKAVKKRANKSGCIIKLKGNRRRPYAVRVTVGRNEKGRPIRKDLDFFEEEQDAKDFLDMYNLMQRKNNNRLSISDEQAKMIDQVLFDKVKSVQNREKEMLTFAEIFQILYEDKYKYQTSRNSKKSWFNNFKKLHDRKINTITLFDLQEVIDNSKDKGKKDSTLSHMKLIASDIFEYAVIHQYINRDNDFTSYIDISIKEKTNTDSPKHIPFTINEIGTLIQTNTIESKIVLIYIFSGCRPIELLNIHTSNIFIDIDNDDDGINKKISYMITGSKTEAGKDRIVPIHDFIKPFIIELLHDHSDYLIVRNNIKDKSLWYRRYFLKAMKQLNMKHLPYDTRHTFSTLAKLNKMDNFSRKRIMGHKSKDITDDVYTHTIINQLYDEIHKIKVQFP